MSVLSDLLAKLLGRAPAPQPAPPAAGFRPQDLVDAMNAERARFGLGRLTLDAKLTELAQNWADHMAREGRLDHGDFFGRIHAAMPGHAAAEDIAMGQASVAAVMKSWMQSPPHRANILGADYTICGVGRTLRDGVIWWCGDFSRLN